MRILFLLVTFLFSANLHFSLYKKGNCGNTLLVIGGIHGNEPGGYYAASFLVMHYKILKGKLYIVPNLNFDSIVEFKRGKYGDMNRKFAYISKKDKDFQIVNDIKKIILLKDVNLVINLHDGHGFYRKSWENSIFNPQAWGQTCIIDQKEINSTNFGNLEEIAKKVARNLNGNLKKEFHIFNVKNTKTKFKDEQMRLSLTYFAITHNKPAFAIETSKNIKNLALKIYYQLKAIEEFMKIMGIEYKRDFDLNLKNIEEILKNNYYVKINNRSILPTRNLRKIIRFFPLTSKDINFNSPNPLIVFKKQKNRYIFQEGYKKLSVIYPQFFKKGCKLKKVEFIIDGKKREVKIPSVIEVKENFKVLSKKRVNVIGYKGKNESDILITKDKLNKKFSIDKSGKIYRVEFYDKDKYCGMVLIKLK